MKHFFSISICIALLLPVLSKAQDDSARSKTTFRLGVFHNSHLNYYGRTDSLRSRGFFPLAEIWFGKNVYINAAPVFVSNAVQNLAYAGTVTTAGYQFNDQSKWAGNFYLVKPFYKEDSRLVQSALKAQVSGTLTRLGKLINITAGGDIKFSNKTDFGAMAGVDHLFRFEWPGKTVLVIDPSAYLHAGTQQFTNTYYKKTNFLLFPGVEQEVSEQVKKFNILSYEFSMPIILAKGKFQFLLIPAYVMPQNLITTAGRPDLSEKGENLFYATLGAKVMF
jgi:hypothetical protein